MKHAAGSHETMSRHANSSTRRWRPRRSWGWGTLSEGALEVLA
jgi:hypothetical protein